MRTGGEDWKPPPLFFMTIRIIYEAGILLFLTIRIFAESEFCCMQDRIQVIRAASALISCAFSNGGLQWTA